MNLSKLRIGYKAFLAAALSLLVPAALTAAVLWSSTSGDVNFSGLTPTTIDNMTIGGTTAAPGTFSTMKLDTGTKTATAVAGAATLNKLSGTITTEALSTAAGGTYTLTITNSSILATDLVLTSIQNGTATTGSPDVTTVTPAAGSLVIIVQNIHASGAFNGTLKITFAALRV